MTRAICHDAHQDHVMYMIRGYNILHYIRNHVSILNKVSYEYFSLYGLFRYEIECILLQTLKTNKYIMFYKNIEKIYINMNVLELGLLLDFA